MRCKVCAGPHSHKECTSRAQPKCANCGGPHPASYGGCYKKKAATVARTAEQTQGKPPKRHEPPPNPDVVFTTTAALSENQSTQRGRAADKTYADAVKKKRGKSVGSSPSSKLLQRTTQDPTNSVACSDPRAPQHDKKISGRQQTGSSEQDVTCLLIPMLFAAIKALIRANPSSGRLPEVEAVLAMEPLVSVSYAPQGRNTTLQ